MTDPEKIKDIVHAIYLLHGHNDDWGVRVIYEDQMVKHLSERLGEIDA